MSELTADNRKVPAGGGAVPFCGLAVWRLGVLQSEIRFHELSGVSHIGGGQRPAAVIDPGGMS